MGFEILSFVKWCWWLNVIRLSIAGNLIHRTIESHASTVDIVRATSSYISPNIALEEGMALRTTCRNTLPMDEFLLKVANKYGEKVLLKDSDKKAKTSKRKTKWRSSSGLICKEKEEQSFEDWQGPPPWDMFSIICSNCFKVNLKNVQGDPAITLELKDGEYSRSMWDFNFQALFKVSSISLYEKNACLVHMAIYCHLGVLHATQ